MQKLNYNYFLKSQLVSLLILLILFNACSIQKRRYNKGFYINKSTQNKAAFHHKIDAEINSNVNATSITIDVVDIDVYEKRESLHEETIAKDKILDHHEKIRLKLDIDTITKKEEKSALQKSNQPIKPKMEFFSKLALIAILINIAMIIAIAVLAIFFTVPETVIVLIILSLFAPPFSLLTALEGKYKTNKNPEKYKWPDITNVIIIASIWMFVISLFYLLILAFVAGVSVAGW